MPRTKMCVPWKAKEQLSHHYGERVFLFMEINLPEICNNVPLLHIIN